MRLGLVAVALPFLATIGCTLRLDWPEHTVRLELVADQGPMETVVANGTEFVVETLTLRASSIELERCRVEPATPFAALAPSLAFAHSVTDTTTHVGAQVLDVLGTPSTIAQWTPPEGNYCAISIEWGSENQAATLDVAGQQRGSGGWNEFQWREMARATTRIELPHRLELGSRTQNIVLTLLARPVEWLEPVAGGSDSARTILQGAATGLEVAM